MFPTQKVFSEKNWDEKNSSNKQKLKNKHLYIYIYKERLYISSMQCIKKKTYNVYKQKGK